MQNTYIYHTRKIAENLFPHINDPIKSSAYDQEGGGGGIKEGLRASKR